MACGAMTGGLRRLVAAAAVGAVLWPVGPACVAWSQTGIDEARSRESVSDWGPKGGQAQAQARYLPPPQAHRPGAYRLGINVQNSPVGVQVVNVAPGSVAQGAGLEAGDTIVSVAGYQVGFVGERLFDLGDEIARRIDPSESVLLLVHNGRTGGLVNVPVRFAAAARTVSGRLLADARTRLPPSAVIVVRVLDVTYPQWQNVPVVQGSLPAGEFPLTYRLELPVLPAGHRYAIEARAEHGGLVVLQTAQPTPLVAVDRSQQVDLVLVGPPGAGTAGPNPSLQPRDQIDQWIRAYLGRQPRAFETEVWLAELARGRSLTNVQAGILSSSELFERAGRSPDLYVAEVHRLLTSRQPTPTEFADLRARYNQALGIRLRFVEGLLQQPR
jgi:uncharacterized lipoprotein YbaY